MRTLIASALVLLPSAPAAGPRPLRELPSGSSEKIRTPEHRDALEEARWCRVCHQGEPFAAAAWGGTAHVEQVCRDCHAGYHFNPHLPVELGPEATATGEGATPEKRRAAARAACMECHTDVMPAGGHVVHGGGKDGVPSADAPTCTDCHGDPHTILATSALGPAERRRQMNERCAACHADGPRMEAAGLTTEPVDTYAHSVHARKLDLGSTTAPGCQDCHGAHALADLQADGVSICGKCHEGATAGFVGLLDHRPYTLEARPVSYFTLKFFGWLTFLTIFALSLHVLLDVFASVRQMLGRRREQPRGGDA